MHLGNFSSGSVVRKMWTSTALDGSSITRATNGAIRIYKNGSTYTTAGVTETEDFDTLVGVHLVVVDTSADAFYVAGADYEAILVGAVIDGKTVNASLFSFSLEARVVNSLTANAQSQIAAAVPDTADITGIVDAAADEVLAALVPKATSVEVAAVTTTLQTDIAALPDEAFITTAKDAVLTALGPKATSTEVAAVTTTLQTDIAALPDEAFVTAAKDAIITALGPKATSLEVAGVETNLAAAIADLPTEVFMSAIESAILTALGPKATSAEVAAVTTTLQTDIAALPDETFITAAKDAVLTALGPKSTSAEVAAVTTTLQTDIAALPDELFITAAKDAILTALGPKATTVEVEAARDALVGHINDVDTALSTIDSAIASLPDGVALDTALADQTNDIFSRELETGMTFASALKVLIAFLVCKSSGGGTATISFRNYLDTLNRIVMSVDESGNRSSVTLNLT